MYALDGSARAGDPHAGTPAKSSSGDASSSPDDGPRSALSINARTPDMINDGIDGARASTARTQTRRLDATSNQI